MNQISLAWREDPSGMFSLDIQIAFTYLCQVLIMPSPGEMIPWDNDCQLIWLPDNTWGKKIRYSSDFLTSPHTWGKEIRHSSDFLTTPHTWGKEMRHPSDFPTSPDTSGEEIHSTYGFLTARHTSGGENRPSFEILTRSNP